MMVKMVKSIQPRVRRFMYIYIQDEHSMEKGKLSSSHLYRIVLFQQPSHSTSPRYFPPLREEAFSPASGHSPYPLSLLPSENITAS